METQPSRHTPGPWAVRYGTNVMAGERSVATCGGYSSNTDWDGKISAENAANARLIAAAPELLEACKYALAIAEARQGGTWDDVMLTMRAVIAKTRGEEV